MAVEDEIQEKLEAHGYKLKTKERLPNDLGVQLRFAGGEIVTVYDKGTVVPQGKNLKRTRELLELPATQGPAHPVELPSGSESRRVFVVYGHDDQARTQLDAMLRRWSCEPLILDQLPSEGQTIIEKLEKYVTQDVRFAVVLATPDDEGHVKGKDDEKKFRARQNVVLELGLLLAKLGRPKVAILLKNQETMERPSDIQGLIYLPFTDNVEETKVQLAKEMQKQGVRVALDKL